MTRFLSFTLSSQEFVMALDAIREVISFPDVSPVPNATPSFLGITNLRDQIIPIFDLRIKFDITPTLTTETAIVICEHNKDLIGVVVDSIDGVITAESAVPVRFGQKNITSEKLDSIPQVVNHSGKLKILVTLDLVIGSDEVFLQEMKNAMTNIKIPA